VREGGARSAPTAEGAGRAERVPTVSKRFNVAVRVITGYVFDKWLRRKSS
jgi:hypothetical protein